MTNKTFRRTLNIAMLITILGTVPYIVGGQTQYRHEVFGMTALILVLYHCIENRFWFTKSVSSRFHMMPGGNRKIFRNVVNILLTISALVVLISGIMVSNVVFRFLRIPYHDFWHYTHFVSGVAFLVLVIAHIYNRKL